MSASTPEGKVKNKIKKILDKYENNIYIFMPVPSGYGGTTLDYLGCMRGKFFTIEAKRAGKWPTERQEVMLGLIQGAGGKTFVVNDDASLAALDQWLAQQLQ